jgi:phosphoribosylformylglycinamidine synthase I
MSRRTPRVAVVTFPGSNCDRDVERALVGLGARAERVWHRTADLDAYDGIVLPGGFSYGDYLRPGALAARSPVMAAVRERAARGVPVLGICNGFQILCEAGLLPGALAVNVSQRFVCEWTDLRVANPPPWWPVAPGFRLRLPIAHRDGAYRAGSPEALARLFDAGLVVLQYCTADGTVDERLSPNGADAAIAAVRNAAGNVLGLMPHPERAWTPLLGGTDGHGFLSAWLEGAVQA